VDAQAAGKSVAEVRRFLADWYQRMRPVYMALVRDGRGATRQTLQRDVNRLFRGNFENGQTLSREVVPIVAVQPYCWLVSIFCRNSATDSVSLRGYSVRTMASARLLARRYPATR
jgi:hypothetical protein